MLNPVFPNYTNREEQDILEENTIEAIQIHGVETYYLPRSGVNSDGVLNEDEYSKFESFAMIEMYPNTFEAFEGNGPLLSKFHLETRDEITLTLSKKRFMQVCPQRPNGPRDGDMIYIPQFGSMWEILYSSSRKTFYQLGKLYTYNLKCALMEYDNQVFETGIKMIDDTYNQMSTDQNQTVIDPGSILPDGFDKSQPIQDLADDVIDFSKQNPFAGNY